MLLTKYLKCALGGLFDYLPGELSRMGETYPSVVLEKIANFKINELKNSVEIFSTF